MPINTLTLALELQKSARGFFIYDSHAVVYTQRKRDIAKLRNRLTVAGFKCLETLAGEGRFGVVCQYDGSYFERLLVVAG